MFSSCRLVIFGAVLTAFLTQTSEALTTFGKTSPTTNNQPPLPPPVKARDCQSESDCAGIPDASCVRDPNDEKKKCLCGDNTGPVNGACANKLKGLRHICTDNKQCMIGMLCLGAANTGASRGSTVALGGVANNGHNGNQQGGGGATGTMKMCMCDVEEGYVEENHECNGGSHSSIGVVTLVSLMMTLRILFAEFVNYKF